MSKVHLPLLERSLGEIRAARTVASNTFLAAARRHPPPVTCHKGCAACCYHPMLISLLEGILLYRYLLKEGRWTTALKEKLRESSDQQYGSTYQVWLLSLTPCPLLDTGTSQCSAYSARPMACRMYLAKSDPYYCHPHRLGPKTEILDRGETLSQFHKVEQDALLKHHVQFVGVPIGMALLLAERVEKGEIPIENIDQEVIETYLAKG